MGASAGIGRKGGRGGEGRNGGDSEVARGMDVLVMDMFGYGWLQLHTYARCVLAQK